MCGLPTKIKSFLKIKIWARQWWRTPLVPTLVRQRQVDLYELKASLVYRVNSRTVRTTQNFSV